MTRIVIFVLDLQTNGIEAGSPDDFIDISTFEVTFPAGKIHNI